MSSSISRSEGATRLPDSFGNPLVSVITIVLDAKDRLERSMESVNAQQSGDLQYVIIDGGSTDGTLDVVHAHEKRIDY